MVEQQADKSLRAVSYCRTSGEGQRDNTSIPRQREDNEKFIASQGWEFVRHYVDESTSGSKVEGREEFQQMLRDAANNRFDVIVPWDVGRFARDGCDIISTAKFLRTTFGVHVLDSKGQFDTRDRRRVLQNFVQAGVAEDERLRIMERCVGGRIRRAKEGLPWSPKLPVGRGFNRSGKHSGEWFITEQGEKLRSLLERYTDGEPLRALAPEYGFSSSYVVDRYIREGQLSGTYQAKFCAPDIGIGRRDAKKKRKAMESLSIPVPAVPQVVTPELMERVRDRMRHNTKWNKQAKRKYLLTGFLTCSHCGHSLTGQTNDGAAYYRHSSYEFEKRKGCPYRGVPGRWLDAHVLDYLFTFFLDEPAYTEAVKAALPSDNDRKALEKDIKAAEKRLAAVDREIQKLVNAIAAGADVGLLLDKQGQLKAEKQATETRLNDLRQTLSTMPDPERIERDAMLLRLCLMQEHKGKDWRKMPYEHVRRFLHFLFGDDPRKTGSGIFVSLEKDRRGEDQWHITFKGNVEFHHDVVNGRPISHLVQIEGERLNYELRRDYEARIQEAEESYRMAIRKTILERNTKAVKPEADNK